MGEGNRQLSLRQLNLIEYTRKLQLNQKFKKIFLYSLQLINVVINAEILFVYGVALKVGVV